MCQGVSEHHRTKGLSWCRVFSAHPLSAWRHSPMRPPAQCLVLARRMTLRLFDTLYNAVTSSVSSMQSEFEWSWLRLYMSPEIVRGEGYSFGHSIAWQSWAHYITALSCLVRSISLVPCGTDCLFRLWHLEPGLLPLRTSCRCATVLSHRHLASHMLSMAILRELVTECACENWAARQLMHHISIYLMSILSAL